jgi:hypothetical protein
MAKRERAAARAAERDRQKRREWGVFVERLARVNGFRDAVALVNSPEAPGPDGPGREYYSNLGHFVMTFGVPGGASAAELRLYIDLMKRMDAAADPPIAPGKAEAVTRDLESAIRSRPIY